MKSLLKGFLLCSVLIVVGVISHIFTPREVVVLDFQVNVQGGRMVNVHNSKGEFFPELVYMQRQVISATTDAVSQDGNYLRVSVVLNNDYTYSGWLDRSDAYLNCLQPEASPCLERLLIVEMK